ncbi:hypothetical protein [Embleya sp. MST-111070]|uniref:hypothetical protein n=1 Tax=Embleya sp. MST-111070 TaxID=3398231 RepID=UPI003F73E8DB
MIHIKRVDLPRDVVTRMEDLTAAITAKPAGDERKQLAEKKWRNTTVRTQVRRPLAETLASMAPGRQHCMYCGDNEGTDIDHHQPMASNPLRTFDWLNHLLACSNCNSHQKRGQYPTDAAGRPLLIDPTAEDPFDHLLLTLALGEYHPLTPKGVATIAVCGLNRPLLTRGRQQARRVVDLSLRGWEDGLRRGDGTAMASAIPTIREQPFADVCQSMLRQAGAPGADIVFADAPGVLELLRTPELSHALLG